MRRNPANRLYSLLACCLPSRLERTREPGRARLPPEWRLSDQTLRPSWCYLISSRSPQVPDGCREAVSQFDTEQSLCIGLCFGCTLKFRLRLFERSQHFDAHVTALHVAFRVCTRTKLSIVATAGVPYLPPILRTQPAGPRMTARPVRSLYEKLRERRNPSRSGCERYAVPTGSFAIAPR